MKKAIEEEGFVGVKVHPSSGFSPYDNYNNGCENTWRLHDKSLKHNPKKARAFDDSLKRLFAYCRDADVPILTHSGRGIPANRTCMEDKAKAKIDWTNSPKQWEAAIKDCDKGGDGRRLRVCLAHFAGGFEKNKKSDEWLAYAIRAMRDNPNIYMDTSAMSEWSKNGKMDPEWSSIVRTFISQNDHLRNQLLYGSDWHMPGAALLGSSYLMEMDAMFAELSSSNPAHANSYSSSIMGRNAVEFYGLAPGRPTRKRLESFYRRNDVDLAKVMWMKKIS